MKKSPKHILTDMSLITLPSLGKQGQQSGLWKPGEVENVPGVADLPSDLFLIVTTFLDAIDLVRCRSVSRRWHEAFTQEFLLRNFLVRNYSRAREVSLLLGQETGDVKGSSSYQSPIVWGNAFQKVASRYCALKAGRPVRVIKLKLRVSSTNGWVPKSVNWDPMGLWRGHLRFRITEANRPCCKSIVKAPIGLKETEWTYDGGLLIHYDVEVSAYVLLDVETNTASVIPFDISNRIVRRLRLKHNVLIIEWAEENTYCDGRYNVGRHCAGMMFGDPHRHFITAFDILPVRGAFPWLPSWEAIFRIQWKLYFKGFSIGARDSIISVHNSKHYAAYIREAERADSLGPTESLLIWDMTVPLCPPRACNSSVDNPLGQHLIKHLKNPDLEHLTIGQGWSNTLRSLELDEGNLYWIEDFCVPNRHPYHVRSDELGYWERVVGIPIVGQGPRWEDKNDDFSAPPMPVGSMIPSGTKYGEPKRATCWHYKGVYPGTRYQWIKDDSGIDFFLKYVTPGHPEIQITSPQGWTTVIDLKGDLDCESWRWTQIACDERWIIVQDMHDLKIFRFDRDIQAGRSQNQGLMKG